MTQSFLGLRAKTARAIAVALVERDDEGPVVELRQELKLWDPRVPSSSQPHHAGLDLPETQARRIVERAERAIARTAKREVAGLVRQLHKRGLRVAGVVVIGSDADPTRIANPHIRAHAAEGRLFRTVLSDAAEACDIDCITLAERRAWEEAAASLGCGVPELKRHALRLGEAAGPPWRADEKLACMAALVAHSRS